MSTITDDDGTGSHSGRKTAAETSESSESSERNGPERIDERLRAVERALTGSDAAVADLGDDAAAAAEREALEARVADLESRVEELEAATEAVRGYVGSVRAVNREVERRADLALARASRGDDLPTDTECETAAGEDTGSCGGGRAGTSASDAVPSEDALDAAVPAAEGDRNAVPPTTDTGAAGASGETDGSWRNEVLDRLRESV